MIPVLATLVHLCFKPLPVFTAISSPVEDFIANFIFTVKSPLALSIFLLRGLQAFWLVHAAVRTTLYAYVAMFLTWLVGKAKGSGSDGSDVEVLGGNKKWWMYRSASFYVRYQEAAPNKWYLGSILFFWYTVFSYYCLFCALFPVLFVEPTAVFYGLLYGFYPILSLYCVREAHLQSEETEASEESEATEETEAFN